MVTHRFGLGEYAKAIDTVAHDSRCLKAVIEP
jgi:threonine dehydrogenase-like Zn-dependent dehydrogenase